jgi:ATP-binding cassette subfamily B (MDR/TAP) protein 1
MSKSEGEAASFLEQLLSSIRIVKVFQASKPLVGVYDNHLGKIQKDGKFIAVSKGITYSGSYSAIFACYALACTFLSLPVLSFVSC